MKYFISAMVEMMGAYETEIEADSYEDAVDMAEEIINDLDARDVCWNDDVEQCGDVEVYADEEEDEEEDEDEGEGEGEEDEEDHEEGVA